MKTITAKRLKEIQEKMQAEVESDDPEIAHQNADTILCDLLNEMGIHKIVQAYNQITKWYA